MEQTEGAPPPPAPPPPPPPPPGGEKADDTPQTEVEELTKDGDESVHKNQGGQTYVSEKQMTADEKCLEEDVQDDLPRQEASGWLPRILSSHASGSSSVDSEIGLPSPSLKHQTRLHGDVKGSRPVRKSKSLDVSHFSSPTSNFIKVQSPNIPSREAAHAGYSPYLYIPSIEHLPIISDWRKGKQMRASSSFDSTDELILGDRKKTYPITAADPTPGHSQDDTRGTELNPTAGLSTFQLSTKDDKDSDSAAFYAREKGVELPGRTVGGHGKPPRKEARSLSPRTYYDLSPRVYGSSSVDREVGLPSPSLEHQTRLQGAVKVPRLVKKLKSLDVSPFSPPTSNWKNVQRPNIPSRKRGLAVHSSSLYIPPIEHVPTISDWRRRKLNRALIRGKSKKTYPSTAADPTPGHSQDDTRGTELNPTAGPSTLQLSTKDDKDSDSAAFYAREKGVELPGRTVGGHGKPPRKEARSLSPRTYYDLSPRVYGSSSVDREVGLPSPSLEHQTRLQGAVKVPRLVKKSKLLDVSPFSPPTSNWNNVQSPYIPSHEAAHAGYSPYLFFPSDEDLLNISDWRKGKQMRASSSFDSTDELILGDRKKTYPITAADPTPGHSQDDTRGTELNPTAGLSTFQLSTKDDKDSDSAAFYDGEKGVELSGSTVGGKPASSNKPARTIIKSTPHLYRPWTENSAQDLQASSSGEKQKEQATHNILLDPGLSYEGLATGYSPLLYLPSYNSPTSSQSIFHPPFSSQYAKRIAHMTADTDSDCDTEHKMQKPQVSFVRKKTSISDIADEFIRRKIEEMYSSSVASARPGQSQDNTRGTASPEQPILGTSHRRYFLPVSRSSQTHADPQKPDGSAREERFPPVTAGNYPTENPRLQQHSPPHIGAMGLSYRSSSLSQIPSEKNRTLTQAENLSYMPLDLSMKRIPKVTADTDSSDSDCDTSECSKVKSAVKHKRKSKIHNSRRKKKSKKSSPGVASTVDPSEYTLARPSPGPLRETGLIKTPSTAADATPGHSQDNTRGTEPHATAGPSTLQHSSASDDLDLLKLLDFSSMFEMRSYSPAVHAAANTWPTVSANPFALQQTDFRVQSPAELSDLYPELELLDDVFPSYSSTVHTAGSGENINDKPQPPECEAGGDSDALVKMKASVTAVSSSVTNTQPTHPYPKMTDYTNTSERSNMTSAVKHKRKSKSHSSRRKKKRKKSSQTVASSSDYTLDRPSSGPLTETGLMKTPSTAADATPGHSQDKTRETELHATAGPSTLQHSSASDDSLSNSGKLLHEILDFQDYDSCSCSPDVNTAESGEDINDKPQPSECEAGGDSDALVKVEEPVTAVSSSVTNTQPTRPHLQLSSDPGRSQRVSSCLPRSHSVPSLSQISSAENETLRPSQSLPDMLLKSSFEEFTPDITVDENDETYRFLCSCPGLYQCSVTGLVFHMEGEGDVVYRIVSWDRRLLAQHHKKPAGPLFDIKCLQQSVCRLHLPHCEIPSTAGCQFLSVAHLNDEGIEFISPDEITETHVIINITGFSGFGNVKDEDSPQEPVRALVLLFYRPLSDQNLTSFLNVLMLPRNVVLRDVRRTRKKLVGDELYIETSSHCKLLPNQEYTLFTCPEDDSVLVQPKEAEFDEESYDNYIPSFQVTFKTVILNMKMLLRDTNSSHIVWEREVCLPSAELKRPSVQGSSDQILKDIRSSFIEGISGPVLKSLLDKLFEKKVLTDSERESADDKHNREDKARFVIDTVRKKGEAASSEMIEFLREVDPFLCKHLGLIVT